jgi:signal transduction histidine kinase
MAANSGLVEKANGRSRDPERILVVDDDDAVRSSVQAVLEGAGFSVDGVSTTGDALDRLQAGGFALALVDLRLPGDGLSLLAELHKHHPHVATVVMTGYASIESAIRAIQLGAYDYLVKPVHPEMLRLAVRHGLDRIRFTRSQQVLEALQRSESDLRRRNAELVALQTISRTVSRADTAERVLGEVLDDVVEVFGVEIGLISVLDPHTRERAISASRGLQASSAPVLMRRHIAEGTPTRQLLGAREPLVIGDLAQAPNLSRSFREAVANERLVTYVGAPVKSHGRVLAVLELGSRVARLIHPEELRLLELVSGQIATALENAQLVERLLEREGKLQQLSLRILRAQEDERKRIARDLHDETAQSLTTLKLMIEMIKQSLPPDREDLTQRVTEAAAAVGRMLQDIRRLIADLRPRMLDDFGLVPTLHWLVQEFSQRYGIRVELHEGQSQGRLPREVETLFYRAVQEALTNVVKHARAREVRVSFERTEERVLVTVQDDGVGFSPRASRRSGLGLLGIRERLSAFGGSLWISSRRGRGTTLTLSVPLKGASPHTRGAHS